MYQQGDVVAYGMAGVCRITALTERDVHGVTTQYYQLEPQQNPGATVLLVPTDNDTLLRRMRPVLTPQQIDALLGSLAETPSDWSDSEVDRKAHYREVFGNGDAYALARMACSLYRQRQRVTAAGRRLRQLDEAAWKDAERLLVDEFVFVLGTERGELVRRLRESA